MPGSTRGAAHGNAEAWIIDAVRSPRGRGKKDKGALSQIHPQRIMAQVLKGLEKRVGFDPGEIDPPGASSVTPGRTCAQLICLDHSKGPVGSIDESASV